MHSQVDHHKSTTLAQAHDARLLMRHPSDMGSNNAITLHHQAHPMINPTSTGQQERMVTFRADTYTCLRLQCDDMPATLPQIGPPSLWRQSGGIVHVTAGNKLASVSVSTFLFLLVA